MPTLLGSYVLAGNSKMFKFFKSFVGHSSLPEMFFHVKKKHLEAINKAKESGIPPESLFLDPKILKKPKKSKKVLKEEPLDEESNFANSRFVSSKESDSEIGQEKNTSNQSKKFGNGFICEVCEVKILRGHYPKHLKSCRYYAKYLTITKVALKCKFCTYEIPKGSHRSNIYRHLKDLHLKGAEKMPENNSNEDTSYKNKKLKKKSENTSYEIQETPLKKEKIANLESNVNNKGQNNANLESNATNRCKICDVTVSSNEAYEKHVKSCQYYAKFMKTTKTDLWCNFCSFRMSKKGFRSNMYRHINENHSKEVKRMNIQQSLNEECVISKTSSDIEIKSESKNNVSENTPIKELNKHTEKQMCPHCNENWSASHLYQHINICKKYSKFFTKTGPAKFLCHICNSQRSQRCDIYTHIKKKHPNHINTSSQLPNEVQNKDVKQSKEIKIKHLLPVKDDSDSEEEMELEGE